MNIVKQTVSLSWNKKKNNETYKKTCFGIDKLKINIIINKIHLAKLNSKHIQQTCDKIKNKIVKTSKDLTLPLPSTTPFKDRWCKKER